MDDRAISTRSETPEAVLHGGNLDEVSRRHPDAPQPWIDLSTGINPIAYPLPPLAPESWARLPTGTDARALLAAAATRYGAASSATLVAAPGTQALLQILPRLRPRCRVAVLGPTYDEHALCWRNGGHEVSEVDDLAGLDRADVAVLVNPNNPTGRLIPRETLTALAARLTERDGLLVVDEAFIDVLSPTDSLVPALPPATLVLRSFGKTYGLAGIRLGFAIGAAGIVAQLREALGPWAVSGPALAIGATALSDQAWLDQARQRLTRDCKRLDGLLIASGGRLIGGTPLFRLAAFADGGLVADRLARRGIHVRQFRYQKDWLRFGLPGDEKAWQRLSAALAAR